MTLSALAGEIDAEVARVTSIEPEELYRLRTGTLDNQAGSYGQFFSTMDIAVGMLRDYASYTLYPMVRLARADDVPVDQVRRTLLEFETVYSNYLGYSGLETLARFATALRAMAPDADKADLAVAIAALARYANRLTAWSHHYFPWALGHQFKYPNPTEAVGWEPIDEPPPSLDGPGPFIRLRWDPLGVEVRAQLAGAKNPDLCAELLAALPFTVLQDHAVVTGKSMFAWTPLMSTAPIHAREEIRRAPIGRLRYSQGTGQKLVLQHGPTSETILAPVLGRVVAEDLHLVAAVGEAVWASTFEDKSLIWLTVTGGTPSAGF